MATFSVAGGYSQGCEDEAHLEQGSPPLHLTRLILQALQLFHINTTITIEDGEAPTRGMLFFSVPPEFCGGEDSQGVAEPRHFFSRIWRHHS